MAPRDAPMRHPRTSATLDRRLATLAASSMIALLARTPSDRLSAGQARCTQRHDCAGRRRGLEERVHSRIHFARDAHAGGSTLHNTRSTLHNTYTTLHTHQPPHVGVATGVSAWQVEMAPSAPSARPAAGSASSRSRPSSARRLPPRPRQHSVHSLTMPTPHPSWTQDRAQHECGSERSPQHRRLRRSRSARPHTPHRPQLWP